jgi:Protein of unknown function (DUF2865)
MRLGMKQNMTSAMRIYIVCSMVCGAGLGLALLAYRLSGPVVATAAAQGEEKSVGSRRSGLAMVNPNLPTRTTPNSAPSKANAPPVIQPVLISRAHSIDAPEPMNGSATQVEAVLPSGDDDEWAGYEPWSPGRSDTYRTVCVRLCDGAYFPISFSTTRNRFKSDAARCQANCGSTAQLFVSKLPSFEAEDLVDVHGAAYADLANAFKFRTSYDPACTCHGKTPEQVALNQGQSAPVIESKIQASGPPVLVAANPPITARVVEPVPVIESRTVADGERKRPVTKPVIVAALTPTDVRPAVAGPTKPTARIRKAALGSAASAVEAPPVVAAKLPAQPAPKAATVRKVAAPPSRPAAPPVAAVVRRPSLAVASRTMARADGASRAQRAFRGGDDYWRLSFWEPRN